MSHPVMERLVFDNMPLDATFIEALKLDKEVWEAFCFFHSMLDSSVDIELYYTIEYLLRSGVILALTVEFDEQTVGRHQLTTYTTNSAISHSGIYDGVLYNIHIEESPYADVLDIGEPESFKLCRILHKNESLVLRQVSAQAIRDIQASGADITFWEFCSLGNEQ